MAAIGDLALDQGHKGLVVDLAVPEGRDEGGYGPFEQHSYLRNAGWLRSPRLAG
jgi:hypothetical protein